ncbi:MAG: glutathione S-transferase N-terminal domain-containing protein [Ectothiorhodospiraceae bacterium]|jgi:glutathione S-transferase
MTDRSEQTGDLTLYYSDFCGFCVRVLQVIDRLGISVELKNVVTEPAYRRELAEGGGKRMVPCLRIRQNSGDDYWMYESADIIHYLVQRFGEEALQSGR